MPSYYDDTPDDESSPFQAESDESTDKPKKDNSEDEATALLPKSILGGKKFKPGDEVVLKIVHEYEDEVEVAYAKREKSEEDSESDREDEMGNSMKMLEESMS